MYERFGGPITIQSVPDPAVAPGEVVVAVLAVGLCRSDYHGWHGTDPDIACPHVGGHEFVGRIVAVGAGVRNHSIGDRIVAPFVCGCGRCEPCMLGQHQVCIRQEQPGFTRWGAFADFATMPFADVNAVRVPEGIGNEIAAIVGCRVSTAYRGVVERGRTTKGETLAVFGCGGVGLAAIAFGKAMGAHVIAVDINRSALDLAEAMGADVRVDSSTLDGATNIGDHLRQHLGGAHVAVDCLGHPATASSSIRALRPLGRHVQIGLFPAPTAELPISRVIRDELELLGVHGLSASRFGEVFSLIEQGRVELGPMIANRIALDDVVDALPAMGTFSTPGVSLVTSGLNM